MRFLTFNSSGRICLTKDLYDNFPPYAVLSHTLGADEEEVTYQDLQHGVAEAKPGYQKIQFCGVQARKDGITHFWIDTCCINVAYNVELSEAIFSMFGWYRGAAKCYVYLSDVSVPKIENQSNQSWEVAFRRARWFTRCWTLQDLLAPKSVDFFSREGRYLGNKQTLEWLINQITDIPISALRGSDLSHFSVGERMRWAYHRQATRTEDKAYSMMGILNVFMPVIYGEGVNAFVRLGKALEAAKEWRDNDDTASIHSVASLNSTAGGSSVTLVGEVLAAANEFINLLLEDQALTPWFSMIFDRIDAERAQRNIQRLLKLYALDLRQEAQGNIEKEAVRLVLTRASYVAYRIRQKYDKSILDQGSEIAQMTRSRALLESYLRSKTTQGMHSSLSESHIDSDDCSDMSDTVSSSEALLDEPELNDLDRVKDFMCNSAAYNKFKQNLKNFVIPRKEPDLQEFVKVNSGSFVSFQTWRRLRIKVVEVFQGLRMLSRPLVPPGHKRITWTCGCGDLRYADVQETRLNGASRLERLLRKSAAATDQYSKGSSPPRLPQSPAQAHISGNSLANGNLHNVSLSEDHSTRSILSNDVTCSSVPHSLGAQSDNMFLLLCLTINGSSVLEQLSIGDLGNDQYLWETIRSRYHDLRGKTLWHQKLSFTRWLSALRWFSWLVTSMDLTSANSIRFVRFQLVPIGMDIRPWNFHSPSIPPEIEVRIKKTYHYDPCPVEVDPTGLNRELLHCLWKPGPHLDRFWLNFLPKKLREALQYAGSKPEVNVGWGIHVVEGVNLASVIFLALSLVSLSAILGIVYSAITHDVGAAFTISAYLIVLPALGVALLQLKSVQ